MNNHSQRVSLSLPTDLVDNLDQFILNRGFQSRSQAVAEIITQGLDAHYEKTGIKTMAGSLTLVYDISKNNCQVTLAQMERKYLKEVISSLQVQLESNHVLEVVLLQGPADQLKRISNEFRACKGVKSGHLVLSSVIMPPIYS